MVNNAASANEVFTGINSKALTRQHSSRNGSYFIFLLPGLILFTLVIILPFLMNVYISFTRWQGTGTPVWIGLTNYQKAMGDSTFWASFRNNLILIIAITIIPTIFGLMLSSLLFNYIANKFGRTITNFFRAGFYLPQILPVAIAGVVLGWLLQPDGAVNFPCGPSDSEVLPTTG